MDIYEEIRRNLLGGKADEVVNLIKNRRLLSSGIGAERGADPGSGYTGVQVPQQ